MLQEKPGKVFFRKLGSRLDIIISLHFYNIYDILQPEKFCDDKNAPNSAFRRGSVPHLTMLSQTS